MKYSKDEFECILDFLKEQQDTMIENHSYGGDGKSFADKEADEWAMETAIEMIQYMAANTDFI